MHLPTSRANDNMEKSIAGKVVVITGGAVGIGYEIADNFLAKKAKVVIILDVNNKQGALAEKTLNSKYGGGKVTFMSCDITNESTLDNISQKIISTYHQVDVLINNAGILNDKLHKKTIDINVTALIEWSLKFWELMKKGNGGTIINLASIYGFRVGPLVPTYHASKFAVMGFTKSLGHEYNHKKTGVRVVAICPGFTDTALADKFPILDDSSTELLDKTLKSVEWQKPEAVGKAAVEVFERAPSGTAWLIEGAKPIVEVVLSSNCP